MKNNILPYNGEAFYYGRVIDSVSADVSFLNLINEIEWTNEKVKIYGKEITTKRKVAWYGDFPFPYKYSNNTKIAIPWTDELLKLKKHIEKITHSQFNSCLLNLYHDGNEGMGWHADNESELELDGTIASLSLGAIRKFSFKHNATKKIESVVLEHGSLLIMQGETQRFWKHSLPKTKKVTDPRINLTYRKLNL